MPGRARYSSRSRARPPPIAEPVGASTTCRTASATARRTRSAATRRSKRRVRTGAWPRSASASSGASVRLRVLALPGQCRLLRQRERFGRELLRARDDSRGPRLHAVTVRDHIGLGRVRRERGERRAFVFGHGRATAVALRPPTPGVLVTIRPRRERHTRPFGAALFEWG